MSVWASASSRAHRSSDPVRFMSCFADTLREIQRGDDVAGARRNLTDPTVVAAQIEALAAHRARTEGFHEKDPWQVAS